MAQKFKSIILCVTLFSLLLFASCKNSKTNVGTNADADLSDGTEISDTEPATSPKTDSTEKIESDKESTVENTENGEPTSDTSAAESTEKGTEDIEPDGEEYLLIYQPGKRSDFRIVFDKTAIDPLTDEVDMMVNMFKNYTGQKIKVADSSNVSSNEIILSSKRRIETAEMLKGLQSGEFAVQVMKGENNGEGKILIATTTYASAYACMELLMESYYSDEDGLRVPYGLNIRGREKSYTLIESTIPYLRDPCIIVDNGVYYAYGTNWHCYKNTSGSLDGSWVDLGVVASVSKANDDGGKHWAPEVHLYNGAYYMFTTYLSKSTGRKGCIILKSDSPEGPFTEITDGHITPLAWDCIDGTLYIDPDGQPWMVFVREWVTAPDNVGSFVAAKLSDDFTRFISEPIELFKADEPTWATMKVTDGCWMYTTKDGELLMLWSNFDAYGYVVAIARSSNGRLDGEWIHENNLLFSKYMTGEYEGGHAMIFTDVDGHMYLSFHSPNSTIDGRREKPVFLAIEEKDGQLVWADKNSQ